MEVALFCFYIIFNNQRIGEGNVLGVVFITEKSEEGNEYVKKFSSLGLRKKWKRRLNHMGKESGQRIVFGGFKKVKIKEMARSFPHLILKRDGSEN